jgi:hypothetical protein
MQLRFFRIPAGDTGCFAEELNAFLRGHRILINHNNIGFRTVRSSEDSPQREHDSDPAAIPSAPPCAVWQTQHARPVPVLAAEAAANAPGGSGCRHEARRPAPSQAAVCDRRNFSAALRGMVIAKIPFYTPTGFLDFERLCAFAALREKILVARAKSQRRKGRWD